LGTRRSEKQSYNEWSWRDVMYVLSESALTGENGPEAG